MSDDFELETLALHTGIHRSQFNEHSEALYLTSSFVFDSAAQAAARFSGGGTGKHLLALYQPHGYGFRRAPCRPGRRGNLCSDFFWDVGNTCLRDGAAFGRGSRYCIAQPVRRHSESVQ